LLRLEAGRKGLEHVNLIDALGIGSSKFESKQGHRVTRALLFFSWNAARVVEFTSVCSRADFR